MTASWSRFLFQLRIHIVKDRNGICLISDRHPGILNAIIDESIGWSPPRAYHRYCLRHICSNFNTHFKNVQLKGVVWQAGSTHQVCKFNFIMGRIRIVNEETWNWLSEIEKEKWTLAHDQRSAIVRGQMLQLLGDVLLSDISSNKMKLMFLPLLEDLDFACRLSQGSAVLACLYKAMYRGSYADQSEIDDYLILLQVCELKIFIFNI